MREEYQIIKIEPGELALKTLEQKRKGARLVQICAVSIENGYELSYSYATGYDFLNYRLVIDENVEIPSISEIFPSAILYENEMAELFGVKIDFIKLDYHNKLYRIDQETPFK